MRVLAADVEREPHIVERGEGREQMIGLEHEADVLAADLGEGFGIGAVDRLPADPHRAAGRRQHTSENGQQRGLAASGRSHQQRELAAGDSQADALEACTRPRAVAQEFDRIDGFDHGGGHRVNTIAGSIRVTFMMAAMADTTHIATVRTNSTAVGTGVMTTGSAVSAWR